MNFLQLAALSWLVWAGYWILARGFVKTTKSTESAALGMLHVVPLAVGIYLIFHGSASTHCSSGLTRLVPFVY